MRNLQGQLTTSLEEDSLLMIEPGRDGSATEKLAALIFWAVFIFKRVSLLVLMAIESTHREERN